MTYKVQDPTRCWFVSDTHFGHAAVIEHSKRPYWNLADMEADLIKRWNAVVKPGDEVFHLGDFSFGKADAITAVMKQLRGRIHLIYGNHDALIRQKPALRELFASVQDVKEVRVGAEQRIFMSHYAHRVWNRSHYGAWNLHGHSHGSLPSEPHLLQMDVGVDATKAYAPVPFSDVVAFMATKTWKPVDGHIRHVK